MDIASLIIDLCGTDIGIAYQPFPNYLPWINFCDNPNRFGTLFEYKQKRQKALKDYHKKRFNTTLIAGYIRECEQRECTQDIIDMIQKFHPPRIIGQRMVIFIKTLTGNTTTLQCCSSDYALTIKILLNEQIGIKPKLQKLIYAGKMLLDQKSVQEMNIQHESTLHLVTTLPNN